MNQKWTTTQLPSEPQADLKMTTKSHQKDSKNTQFIRCTNMDPSWLSKKTELPFHNCVPKLFLATLKTTAVVFQSTILNDATFVSKATSGLIFILVFVIYESHTKI